MTWDTSHARILSRNVSNDRQMEGKVLCHLGYIDSWPCWVLSLLFLVSSFPRYAQRDAHGMRNENA